MFVGKNATLFAVANAVAFCVFVSKPPLVDSTTEEYDDPFLAKGCSCGPNSNGCEVLQNGTQVCQCNYLYRQIGKTCSAYCEENNHCSNGGTCVEGSCRCLPGTRGDFCKTVDECEGDKGRDMCGEIRGEDDTAICVYNRDTQKPFCECSNIEYVFYPENRTCIECYCGNGNCTLIEGTKTCECPEGSALKQYQFMGKIHEMCKECECGNNSGGCFFEGLNNKICNCTNGTAQQSDPHGDICHECYCGENGVCFFEKNVKKCVCEPGYAFQDDSCKRANTQDKRLSGGTIALIVLGVLIGVCAVSTVAVILRRRNTKASHLGTELPFGEM